VSLQLPNLSLGGKEGISAINEQFFAGKDMSLSDLEFTPSLDLEMKTKIKRMQLMGQQADPKLVFRGTLDTETNAWNEVIDQGMNDHVGIEKSTKAFRASKGITAKEQEGIETWIASYKVTNDLKTALAKLPNYDGYAIRCTQLDAGTLNALNGAIESGGSVPLSQLVQGGFQKTSKYVDKALAATPAGNRLYASEPYELIIKSETGRYITPASEHLFSKLSF
jgi:hypothetical protein